MKREEKPPPTSQTGEPEPNTIKAPKSPEFHLQACVGRWLCIVLYEFVF